MELRLRGAKQVAEVNRRLALTDPLTGLPNRRHLELHLDRVLAHDGPCPLSLVLFDVDDFKRFNDRHGHVAGDRVLATVATVFSRASASVSRQLGSPSSPDWPESRHRPPARSGFVCDSPFAARLGGDEFVTTLPANPPGKARDAARLMAKAVARHPQLSRHGVTVSFGVATSHAGLRRWQELLAAADEDLRRRRSAQRALPGSLRAGVFGLHGRDEP